MTLSPERKRYVAIMSMIGSGHGLSHLHLLALPPLFPLLKADFGVSYAALGLLVALMNLAAGLVQVPVGVLVDWLGARRVLVCGLLISGLGVGLVGLASEYWMMLAFVLIAGIGNSVFHPADYAIISGAIDHRRFGRAFALHTFAGNLGFMIAPATMLLLSSLWGWRAALVLVGSASLALAAVFWRYGRLLDDGAAPARAPLGDKAAEAGGRPPVAGSLRLLTAPPVLTMFAFFVLISMVTSGVQSFSVTALVDSQGTGLAAANTILTAFLVASALGVLLGGHLADRTRRHGLVAVCALVASAVLLFFVGRVQLPVLALIVAFASIGLLQGSIRPSRDMMVRAVTPKGASGRVFAFVSAGLNLGGAISPVLFGFLVDLGYAQEVFVLMSVVLLLAVATVGLARRRPRSVPAPAE